MEIKSKLFKKILSLGFPITGGIILAGISIYISAKQKNPKFEYFNKLDKLHSYNLFHNNGSLFSQSTSISKYGIFLDNNYKTTRYPSDIKRVKDVDNIFKFTNYNIYSNTVLVGTEAFDEIGTLILYFVDSKIYSETNIDNIEPKEMQRVIISGFLKKERKSSSNEVKTTLTANNQPNNIGFYYQNNAKKYLGNGNFFNFLKPNNEKYPTKWFLLTAGHLFYDLFDKNSFDLNIFNTSIDIQVKAKVIQDGRNQWNSELSFFKKFLPDNLKEKEILPYLDYAILEINFKNAEDARKVTSINIEENVFHKTYGLNNSVGYYDLNDNNQPVYKYINNSNRYNYKYSNQNGVQNPSRYYIYSYLEVPYLKNQKVFTINGKLYIDLSYYEIFTDTQLGFASSGLVANPLYIPYIKLAENDIDGLWMILWNSYRITLDYREIFRKQFNEETYEAYSNLSYNILFEDKYAPNQNKSFEKTFNELYKNQELGFKKEDLFVNFSDYSIPSKK
ncbi:hypothetical protein [Mycoplasma buteonis]|uniref:hypothetical protein n=1 Tax=Mycoplasma buteonis TaxID=171280 RepID=UPI0005612806|nr:hypothetical protein [Mycoplasma buteonis]